MVLKLLFGFFANPLMFESSVNSDGTQTKRAKLERGKMFESSVNSDGTQTTPMYCKNFRSV